VGVAPHLASLTRAQASLIRQLLRDKRARSNEGAFIVEGTKACLDLIRRHPHSILTLVISPQYLRVETDTDRRIRTRLRARQCVCPDALFDKLTDVEMPQGVLAVVRQPQWDEAQVLGQSSVLGIYGVRLQDPANVGAIIRTAAALNLSGVWLSADSTDCFSPKVVRAAAGTMLTLPIFPSRNVQTVSSYGCEIYSTVLPSVDTVPIREIRTIPSRLVIAVGNEGLGLTSDVLEASRVKFFIPIAEGVESLNVAAAVAISAFYFSGLPIDRPGPVTSSRHSA
jgi:RNA methyltransferase, TrmH family